MTDSTNTLQHEAAAARGSPVEVFGAFLVGLTSFGGPIAHLGYFRSEFVERRRWLDDRSYSDLVALCQFLPGPASSQVGMALGLGRAGWLGLLAAWAGFTLPSAIALILFAFGIAEYQGWPSPAGCTGSRSSPWPSWRKRSGDGQVVVPGPAARRAGHSGGAADHGPALGRGTACRHRGGRAAGLVDIEDRATRRRPRPQLPRLAQAGHRGAVVCRTARRAAPVGGSHGLVHDSPAGRCTAPVHWSSAVDTLCCRCCRPRWCPAAS